MATGYEQARSVVAALAGDWQAARDVRLDLPETGVCSSNVPLDTDRIDSDAAGCCGPKVAAPAVLGLATGMEGGLLRTPLTVIDVSEPSAEQAGGCCN
jgi:hypothetical protein